MATLPYYLEELRRVVPNVPTVALNLQYPTKEVAALSPGARVLIVLHSPHLLKYAAAVLETLRDDTASYAAVPLCQYAEWQAQIQAADVVFTDCMAATFIQRHQPRRIVELRIIAPASLNELRTKLSFAWPGTKLILPQSHCQAESPAVAVASNLML